MADNHRIIYDNQYADSFFVFTDDGIVEFKRKNRLYTYKPSDGYLEDIADQKNMLPPDYDAAVEVHQAMLNNQMDDDDEWDDLPELLSRRQDNTITWCRGQSNMVNTVAEALRGFTKKQIEGAKEARKLYLLD